MDRLVPRAKDGYVGAGGGARRAIKMLADEASIDTGKPLPASLFNVEKKGHQMASVSAGKISAVYLSLSLSW
jgi:hypothetical protein